MVTNCIINITMTTRIKKCLVVFIERVICRQVTLVKKIFPDLIVTSAEINKEDNIHISLFWSEVWRLHFEKEFVGAQLSLNVLI